MSSSSDEEDLDFTDFSSSMATGGPMPGEDNEPSRPVFKAGQRSRWMNNWKSRMEGRLKGASHLSDASTIMTNTTMSKDSWGIAYEDDAHPDIPPNYDSTRKDQKTGLVGVLQFMHKGELWASKRELFTAADVERAQRLAKCLVGYIVQGLDQEESVRVFADLLVKRSERIANERRMAARRVIQAELKQREADELAFKLWNHGGQLEGGN